MTGWRARWHVTIASNINSRDGIGWEFSRAETQEDVWFVFREDGGPFPVFSATRGDGALPSQDDLEEMTREAVADLLSSAGLADEVGWLTRNIAAALQFASVDIDAWEGLEWALESGAGDEALTWAGPDAARTPYAWLRAIGDHSEPVITIYQDDANFGLSFLPTGDCTLPESEEGSLRPQPQLPLVRGPITHVELAFDTTVDGGQGPGLVTEVVLYGDGTSTLLLAAEAYSRDEWHLHDESVVAVSDPRRADELLWVPVRQGW